MESWADFLAVREMGFDLVQGFLFAKPLSPQKFVQTCWVTSQPALAAPRDAGRAALAFTPCAEMLAEPRYRSDLIRPLET